MSYSDILLFTNMYNIKQKNNQKINVQQKRSPKDKHTLDSPANA